MVKCAFPSWDEIHSNCKKVAKKIAESGFRPDVVVALSRGGFVPARTMCDLLIIKDLVSIKISHWGITATKDGKAELKYPVDISLEGKNVLVVDDITDSGESLELAENWVRERKPKDVKTATVYHINHSKFVPDFFAVEVPKENWRWVVFPWNFVEDMCNLIPKDMEEANKMFTTEELRNYFEDKHDVKVSDELMTEALDHLENKLILKKDESGKWGRL